MDKKINSDIVKMNMDRIRAEKGISREEIAKGMGISKKSLAWYFTPSNEKGISEQKLELMAEALGVNTKELLYSEARNVRYKYHKAKKEFYDTRTGKTVALGIILSVIYLFFFYHDIPVVSQVCILAILFMADFAGIVRPLEEIDNCRIYHKIGFYAFRVLEILIACGIIIYPLINMFFSL